ncbi:exocyst complex component exo70 subunit [Stereum hirsutum FP-91666 SS1]|uniref:exocyst complex component exo70 subunit n=1 Tax=Stereum hirsutum (strain FP-91666) TaxID=721885 RepID=UPI000440C225|nr:exocyst complex component exo70 subunit [Stereum hirsutum FP-91666 SS1]EIM89544.1 exocyst complex component exo70 subunit [Stereum hirsutum FP-91666 SS1]
MDDETAEIELLEQNLNKTRQISQRMTTILSSLDGRLIKLEKSILPLYTSTQVLTRRGNNIEAALQKIYEVASSQEGSAAEEALILRGPQPDQLGAYQDALERLNASIAFKAQDRDSGARENARLVESGAKKLAQMFTKLVAEGSSGTPPASTDFELSTFSPSLMADLKPLVAFLRTLPLPSTHPSHPAAPAILSTLKEAQNGYADMRGNWSKKCLEAYGRRVVERAETMEGVPAGRELGKWIENLLEVAESEYNLLNELSPLQNPSLLATTFATLLNPIIRLYNDTMSSLSSLIKRSLHKYTFLALSSYSALASHQASWDSLITRRADRSANELRDGLNSLRGVCLRSFPEFLADLKLAALGKGGELGTGLADFTVSTVRYMEQIVQVQDGVGSSLVALGDGNWKMGEGMRAAANKGPKLGEGSEHILIEHYIYDVVNTTIGSLQTLSRSERIPAFGSVFLLNNISYLRTYLLRPRAPLFALLSRPTQDVITSSFRTAKAGYFDSNFSPLIQVLADDKDSKGGKAAMKEKFVRFFDLLEEVKERHKMAKVLEGDDEDDAREMLMEEAVKLVVPSLQRFTQKTKEKEFSKNPSKYIKMSPEEVETQIRSLY